MARKIGAIFGLALLLLAGPVTADAARPLIAIIIDDLGYERAAGERAIRLPGPVTFAVLPCTPRGSYLAERAHAAGKDVILHLPLQAESRDQKPDPGSLLLDMSRAEFVDTLRADMATVPYLSGINSHRGSLLTRHPGHMGWLMDEIARHESLFFVDSYTTAESVALVIAAENGVPSIKRDVFLDPDRDPATLPREFARLKKLADAQGFAVGIGHPYAATLDFLELALPGLYADGYELVRVSSLVDTPARNAMTQFKPGAD